MQSKESDERQPGQAAPVCLAGHGGRQTGRQSTRAATRKEGDNYIDA